MVLMTTQKPHIVGALQAVTVITNSWAQSIRFYTEALGYKIIERGELTHLQKKTFGRHLGKFALLGYNAGAVVRLIETGNAGALPNRIGAHLWDNGLSVMEACTANIERAYWKVLRARFGAISHLGEFDLDTDTFGNHPTNTAKSVAFIGPSGEQLVVKQLSDCVEGCEGINAPATAVISVPGQALQSTYSEVLGTLSETVFRANGLPAFCNANTYSNAEFEGSTMNYEQLCTHGGQSVFSEYTKDNLTLYPCDFMKTGVASACWQGQDVEMLRFKLQEANWSILSEIGLPIRNNPEPEALVFQGPVGEILELLA